MRHFADVASLSGVVRAAVGEAHPVVAVQRLRGGTKKGVYRVHLDGDGPTTVVVYTWAESENFWPAASHDPTDPFAPASGLSPFVAAQRLLDGLGVRVPRVLWADDSKQLYAADVAVVEDFRFGTLEELMSSDPARATDTVIDLARMLHRMQQSHKTRYGKVAEFDNDAAALEVACEKLVLDRALRDLAEAAGRADRIRATRGRLDARLRELSSLVKPRVDYGLVHGELGPDHVLVDEQGRAVLIDIEGLMYFDVEWEHVFLQLRFHQHYATLARPGLDPRRLDLYMLAMRLSLVAGPLRLLDGDFPDRDFMRGFAEHNLAEALALLH